MTIFRGPRIYGWDSCNASDRYAKEAKSPRQAHMHRTDERPTKSARRELEDIVFIEADARWVQHPHADALIIIIKMANSNVHRMLVDNRSVVDIIYLNAYNMMVLFERELSPTTSPL